ncbi:MAG UNVERIFIED_CONTAM: hypothetical protein LVQ98_02560 [Rickettsiaceae bacterium]|jgi:hypothetical protein
MYVSVRTLNTRFTLEIPGTDYSLVLYKEYDSWKGRMATADDMHYLLFDVSGGKVTNPHPMLSAAADPTFQWGYQDFGTQELLPAAQQALQNPEVRDALGIDTRS